jgi:hypothetical protein
MVMAAGVRFELANPANEAGLRRLFRDTPLSGDIRISLEREPNAFHAAAVSGDQYQLIMGYGEQAQTLLGAGGRFELDAYVNGKPQRLGYLGELRIAGGLRQRRRLLIEAYRALRHYHVGSATPFYLTTIIAANTSTRRLLEAGLNDMPTYRPLETLVTLVIPAKAGARSGRSSRRVETAGEGTMTDIEELLAQHGRNYQFHPVWNERALRSQERCRDLGPQDFVLCRDGERLRGCLALWDQRLFKQTVIRSYAKRIDRIRPFLNLLSPMTGRPRLPGPGTRLESAMLSHVAVEADDGDTLDALIRQACRQALERRLDYVMISFAERHPLSAVVQKRFPCYCYVSMIYVVYWEDGKAAADRLDGRMPHPEVAIL